MIIIKKTANSKLFKFLLQLSKFLFAGLPSFIIALPLNWFLVEKVELIKPISYIITLFFQVTVNFFFLRKYVFVNGQKNRLLISYIKFLSGISFFRLLDWGFYVFLVESTTLHYLVIQISNIIIFSLFKFFFSKKIMDN